MEHSIRTGKRRGRATRGGMLLALALACVCVRSGVSSDWPSGGSSPSNERSSAESISVPLSDPPAGGAWSVSLGASSTATPVVGDGVVYAVTTDGWLHALRESDGSAAWPAPVRLVDFDSNACNSSPVVTAGRVIVAGMDQSLTAFDASTGTLLWQTSTGGNTISSPVAMNGTLYLAAGFPSKEVRAVDAGTGALVWTSLLETISYSPPASDGTRIFTGSVGGRFYGLDAADGTELWNVQTGGNVFAAGPVVSAGRVFLVPGEGHDRIYAVSAVDGSPVWDAPIQDPSLGLGAWGNLRASSAAVSSGLVLYTAGDRGGGDLYTFARDAATGSFVWAQTIGGTHPLTGASASPACSATHAFVCGQSVPAIYALNLATGVVEDTRMLDAPAVAAPAIANGRVYVATLGGTLYAFGGGNSAPPAPTTGFGPTGGVDVFADTASLTWDPVVGDPDAPITYSVLYDIDGTLAGYQELSVGTATSLTIGPLPDNAAVVWAVRAQDALGARSPPAATQSFFIRLSPSPPAAFTATPSSGGAVLTWTASPSTDIDHYEAAVALSGTGLYGSLVNVGSTGTYAWSPLVNNVAYDFSLVAVDSSGLASAAVTSSVIPGLPVTLESDGAPVSYASLETALAAASSGDTVRLGSGVYSLLTGITVPDDVTLAGVGAHLSRIDGRGMAGAAVTISGGSSGAAVTELAISSAGIGVDVDGAVATIRNVVVHGSTIGVRAQNGAQIDVVNATVATTGAAGDIGIDLTDSEGIIRNTLVTGGGLAGIRADSASVALTTLAYNDVTGSFTNGYDGLTAGTGSIATAVTFADATAPAWDYREVAGSATVDAGDPADAYSLEPYYNGGRINIGAFGNTAEATTSSAPVGQDTDGDGILNADEMALGTDPNAADTDGDGTSDLVEIGGDPANPADTDGDGVWDALEPGVAAGAAGELAFVVSGTEADALGLTILEGDTIDLSASGGATLSRVVTAGYATPVENTTPEGGGASGYTMPLGVLRFNAGVAVGGTTTVTVTYGAGTAIPANAVYLKYSGGAWSVFSGAAGLGDGDNTFTLTLTDGGPGDDDPAAGVILDPGGIGVPVPAPPAPAAGATTTVPAGAAETTSAATGGTSGGGSGGGCFVGNAAGSEGCSLLLWLLLALAGCAGGLLSGVRCSENP